VANRNLAKAAQTIDAPQLQPPTATVIAELERLHPPADPSICPPTEAAPVQISAARLCGVLRALPKGKAGGPSGWTYEHVRAADDTSPAAFEAILKLVNWMITGQLPHLDLLLDSNLIAVEKPNGGGTRPIVVGEVWVRIARLGTMAARPAANASLLPLQLGVGVHGGTEAIGHALQTALASDPELQLGRIDYQNAFTTMSCSAILQAGAHRAPELLAYIHWAYGQPSRVWVVGSEDGAAPILSSVGVRQGDSMGPILFALALQTPLEEAMAAHLVPDAHLAAVHDDVTLVDRPNRMEALHKSRGCAKAESPHETEGIVVAGSPIGSPSFVQAFGSKTAKAVMSKVEKVMELPLELQHKHLLLRLSMVPLLAYLMRTGPLDPAAGTMFAFGREAARVIQQAGADMAGHFAILTAEMQLGLPLQLGGCGLPIPSPTLSAAARLSSAALTQAALRQGPAIFRPFDWPHCAILQQTWETLKSTAADLCSPETATLQAALEHGTLARHSIASVTTKPSAPMKPCSAQPTASPPPHGCSDSSGYAVLPVVQGQPGWRPCPQHPHCAWTMVPSALPFAAATASPTCPPALQTPLASVGQA
jgi:hypothetical protein